MDHENGTNAADFILLGLSERPELQSALFTLFLAMYMVGLVSNSTIMTAIATNPLLHNPMYFFIGNLSLVDICITTITVPQLLVNIISESKTISSRHCLLQLYFAVAVIGTDSLLLGAMAYDRYVAICNPLHYFLVMDKKVCIELAVGSWVPAQLNALLLTMMIARLNFCRSKKIQNFFCDVPPLLKLSCSDTFIIELLIMVEATPLAMISILSITISYSLIVITILRIRSREGRQKTFSTCSSHLIVVSLYYGSIFFNYVRPASSYALEKDKVVTVMYTIVTPMLNPFIYSLRNDQIKGALRKLVRRGRLSLIS